MAYPDDPFNTQSPRLAIEVLEFKAFERQTLKGFAKIRFRDLGLIVEDVAVHDRDGRRWAQLPSKPCLDHDRRLMVDPSTGKPRYVRILGFDGRDQSDAFSAAVLGGVDALRQGGAR